MLAYIDPGNGSYVIQLLLAVILGIAYTLKNIRFSLLRFFRKFFKSNK